MPIRHDVRRLNTGIPTGFFSEKQHRGPSSPVNDPDVARRRFKGGGSVGGIIGTALGVALAPATGGASLALSAGLGGALGGTLGGMIDGQSFGSALKGGLLTGALSGATAGLGGLAAGALGGAGLSPLAANALGYGMAGLGTGALGAAATGGNVAKGALMGGALGAAGGALSSYMGTSSGTSGEAAGASPEGGLGADLSGTAPSVEAAMPTPSFEGAMPSSSLGTLADGSNVYGYDFGTSGMTDGLGATDFGSSMSLTGVPDASGTYSSGVGTPQTVTQEAAFLPYPEAVQPPVEPSGFQNTSDATGWMNKYADQIGVSELPAPEMSFTDKLQGYGNQAVDWVKAHPLQSGLLGAGALAALAPMFSSGATQPSAAQTSLPGSGGQYWNQPLPSYDYSGQAARGRIPMTGDPRLYGRAANPGEQLFFNPVVSSPVRASSGALGSY